MTEQYINFGETTLASAIDASQTTVPVSVGSVFPATGNFRLVVDDEIMLVTARSTNDLTVTRGAESSTAAVHTSGTRASLMLTAASLAAIISETGLDSGRQKRTAGAITLNSTSWIDIPGISDITVPAVAGNILLIHFVGHFGNQAPAVGLDAVTRVAGAAVNVVSGSAAADYGFLYVPAGVASTCTPLFQYVVVSGDVENGNVTLRMRYKTSSAANRTLFAGTAGDPMSHWGVVNLR